MGVVGKNNLIHFFNLIRFKIALYRYYVKKKKILYVPYFKKSSQGRGTYKARVITKTYVPKSCLSLNLFCNFSKNVC